MPESKAKGPWVPIRTSSDGHDNSAPPLPGKRGRYLLYLGTGVIDPIDGKGRYVHFSWQNDAFCIRDFITGMERRESEDLTVALVWRRALDRIPATGDYYKPHGEGKFWKETLEKLTAEYHGNQRRLP
jgi:hypothetical protein